LREGKKRVGEDSERAFLEGRHRRSGRKRDHHLPMTRGKGKGKEGKRGYAKDNSGGGNCLEKTKPNQKLIQP